MKDKEQVLKLKELVNKKLSNIRTNNQEREKIDSIYKEKMWGIKLKNHIAKF